MNRSHLALLLLLIAVVPGAIAAAAMLRTEPAQESCFMSGGVAYRLSSNAEASYTVRVEESAARPDLRLQLVDDPALADFVLVDDEDNEACRGTAASRSIRVDAAAAKPYVSVALSKDAGPGGYKVYLHSAHFSGQDAAALFAVIWKSARGREFLARR